MKTHDWKPEYEVGFEDIDLQHKNFLHIINKLITHQDKPKDTVFAYLQELCFYAKYHFMSEENYMTITSFPKTDRHKSEHQLLLGQVLQKSYEFKDGKANLKEIISFSVKWFLIHTSNEDKSLGKYLSDFYRNDRNV